MASFYLGWRLGPLDSHLEGMCGGGWGGRGGIPSTNISPLSLSFLCVFVCGLGGGSYLPMSRLSLFFFYLIITCTFLAGVHIEDGAARLVEDHPRNRDAGGTHSQPYY
jgi:hypothetical protein